MYNENIKYNTYILYQALGDKMKIIHLKKAILAAMIIPFIPSLMQGQTLRGSIISADNKTLAYTDANTSRSHPFADACAPILGYSSSKNGGKQGIEKSYNKTLADGKNVQLNIDLALQQKIETIIDIRRIHYTADEILVGVMDSQTGKVIALATSRRYIPSHIREKDIPALNPKFAEYPYEPGSVMKPISIAIALDHGLVTPETIFDTHNGKLKIGENHTITDDDKFESLNVTDIIVHSSNVGTSLISWKLTGKEFRDGLLKFGFSKPSGVDLSRDLPGVVKDEAKTDNKLHRANSSYGYGMMASLLQLMKAYASFNNGGLIVTPKVVASSNSSSSRVISKKTSQDMHNILLEVVKRGTGIKAQYRGLEIGGKTGTAHIAKDGRYVREYHSSFYGFANDDKGHRYTIGVLVIRAKAKYKYFASKSAVPVFRAVVEALVKGSFLNLK